MLPLGYVSHLNQAILVDKTILHLDECKNVINLFNHLKDENHPLIQRGGISFENSEDTSVRNVLICNFEEVFAATNSPFLLEIRQKILNALNELNANVFQFKLSHLDAMQIAEYGPDCHYDWHTDLEDFSGNVCRKLSFSILLNNPNEYEGGYLVFDSEDKLDLSIDAWKKMDAGSLVIFPPWIRHKVYPVTSGKRYQIFGWVYGPRWE